MTHHRTARTERPTDLCPAILVAAATTALSLAALAGAQGMMGPPPPAASVPEFGTTPDLNGNPRFWSFHPTPFPTENGVPTSDAVTLTSHPWIRPSYRNTSNSHSMIGAYPFGDDQGEEVYATFREWVDDGRITGTDDLCIYFERFGDSKIIDDLNLTLIMASADAFSGSATCDNGSGPCASYMYERTTGNYDVYPWKERCTWTENSVAHWQAYMDDFISGYNTAHGEDESRPMGVDLLPIRGMFDYEQPQILVAGQNKDEVYIWENMAGDSRASTLELPGFGVANGYVTPHTYATLAASAASVDPDIVAPTAGLRPDHDDNKPWWQWWRNTTRQILDGSLDEAGYAPLRTAFPGMKSGNYATSVSTDGGVGPEVLERRPLTARHNPSLNLEYGTYWNGSGDVQCPVFYTAGVTLMADDYPNDPGYVTPYDKDTDLNGWLDTVLRIHAHNADAIQHSFGGGVGSEPLHTNIVPYIQLPNRLESSSLALATSESHTRDLLVLCRSKQINEFFVFNKQNTPWNDTILNWDILQGTAEQAYSGEVDSAFAVNEHVSASGNGGAELEFSDYDYVSFTPVNANRTQPSVVQLLFRLDDSASEQHRVYVDMRLDGDVDEEAEITFDFIDWTTGNPAGETVGFGMVPMSMDEITTFSLTSGRQSFRFDMPDDEDFYSVQTDGSRLVSVVVSITRDAPSTAALLVDFAAVIPSDILTPEPIEPCEFPEADLTEPEGVDWGDYIWALTHQGSCDFCESDINGDGSIDTADLGLLISQFGQDCVVDPCSADLNGDDVVDTADLGILFADFGKVCVGDFNADCQIDNADAALILDFLRGNYCP